MRLYVELQLWMGVLAGVGKGEILKGVEGAQALHKILF